MNEIKARKIWPCLKVKLFNIVFRSFLQHLGSQLAAILRSCCECQISFAHRIYGIRNVELSITLEFFCLLLQQSCSTLFISYCMVQNTPNSWAYCNHYKLSMQVIHKYIFNMLYIYPITHTFEHAYKIRFCMNFTQEILKLFCLQYQDFQTHHDNE